MILTAAFSSYQRGFLALCVFLRVWMVFVEDNNLSLNIRPYLFLLSYKHFEGGFCLDQLYIRYRTTQLLNLTGVQKHRSYGTVYGACDLLTLF